jgi:hypothetical protein
MACYLWITGDFDPEPVLARVEWEVDWHRKGEPTPRGEPFKWSVIQLCASDAGFDQFDEQIADAIEFLGEESAALNIIRSTPGVDEMMMVFGAAQHNQPSYGYTFPARLLELAGRNSVNVQLSLYAVAGLFGFESL